MMTSVRTYQARLTLEHEQSAAFDAYGQRFGSALRTLHAQRRAGITDDKPSCMRAFGLTARQFNAIRVVLDGMERSIRDRRPAVIDDLRRRIASAQRRRHRTVDPMNAHHLNRRIARLEQRLRVLESDAAANRIRLCFGSRRLFHAQHALAENHHTDHDEWARAWRQARSNAFFVLGSKDETAGCQGCVARHLGDGRFSFRLRLPNASTQKYVVFQTRFRYGWEHLAWALAAGQAISYRFLRDQKGWRIFASTLPPPVEQISDRSRGALGVDLNADHVALSLTKHDGNLVAFDRLALVTYGVSSERAKTLLGETIKTVVACAVAARVPIVVEKLDFAKKKARLREYGARYARMLSSFAYRRFVQTLCARAHDTGIAVIFANPAYSSLIGRYKFARRYGVSGHLAAALVLARRAQRFSERPNRHDRVTLASPARKNARHVWSLWSGIARRAARNASYGRSRLRDPAVAAASAVTLPFVAGGSPARQSVAPAVRAAS